MEKVTLKIMPDYECFPLWKISDHGLENIHPAEIPISGSLVNRLLIWQDKYDVTLNTACPPESGFRDGIAELEFEKEGLAMFGVMAAEVGKDYDIQYSSVRTGILHKSIEECNISK